MSNYDVLKHNKKATEILEAFLNLPSALQGPAGLYVYTVANASGCEKEGRTSERALKTLNHAIDQGRSGELTAFVSLMDKVNALTSEDSSTTIEEIKELSKTMMLLGYLETSVTRSVGELLTRPQGGGPTGSNPRPCSVPA